MDKSRSTENQLSAARQYLHMALLEHRAATEELQANNLELAAILEEFLSVREELRGLAGNHADNHADGDVPKPTPKDLDLAHLQQEADKALHTGQHAMRESALLRQKSQKVRAGLRNGFGGNHKPAVTDHGGLSKRERQVLALMVAGKTSKQIAVELGISFKTAVTHRTSIMGKLDVHEVASVVREAIRRGLA
jgi:DNA-binding CsgD family transcriptional regulator